MDPPGAESHPDEAGEKKKKKKRLTGLQRWQRKRKAWAGHAAPSDSWFPNDSRQAVMRPRDAKRMREDPTKFTAMMAYARILPDDHPRVLTGCLFDACCTGASGISKPISRRSTPTRQT